MKITEFIVYLSKFNLPTVAIAFATVVVTGIVKTKLLKGKHSKITTFLPFVIGAILSAAIALVLGDNLDLQIIVANGISAGGIATVIYNFYAQFFKYGETESVPVQLIIIEALLSGYVEELQLKAVSLDIYEKSMPFFGDAEKLFDTISELLTDKMKENADSNGLLLLSKLITNTLISLE